MTEPREGAGSRVRRVKGSLVAMQWPRADMRLVSLFLAQGLMVEKAAKCQS